MLELKFQHISLDEVVVYRIDRKNKKFWASNSKTDYQIMKMKWFDLFDPRKEKAQDKLTEHFTDEEFKTLIIIEMLKAGYKQHGSPNRKTN